MHPKIMIALAHEVESDRQRQRRQATQRSLALHQRRMGAGSFTTRMAAVNLRGACSFVPRRLARPS